MTFTLWSQWWLMWNIASISLVLVIRRNRLRVQAASPRPENRLALGSLAHQVAVDMPVRAPGTHTTDAQTRVRPAASQAPEIMAVRCTLRALDPSARKHEVVLLERDRLHLRLQSLSSIAPGTAAQLKLEGESLLGEVTASIARNGHFEVWVQLQEVLLDSWQPHPDWNIQDSDESMAGSLGALNARLMLHEKQRVNSASEPLNVEKLSQRV